MKCCSQQNMVECYLVCLCFHVRAELCLSCGEIFVDMSKRVRRFAMWFWTGKVAVPEEVKKDFEFGGKFYGR